MFKANLELSFKCKVTCVQVYVSENVPAVEKKFLLEENLVCE